jgi:hypothetical protein
MAGRHAVIDVHDRETVDRDRAVELVDLDAAADAVAGAVDQAVAVFVGHVFRDDRQVADVNFEVRVRGVGTAGVEDDQLIGPAFVGDRGNMDAGGGELLGQDLAVFETREIEDDVGLGRTFLVRRLRGRGWRCRRQRARRRRHHWRR